MLIAFGFLPGKEILEAGLANAGLRDREWIYQILKELYQPPMSPLNIRTLCSRVGPKEY